MKLRTTLLVLAVIATPAAWAANPPAVDVYKSPTCGCCAKWVEHLRKNGFAVAVHEVTDVPAARARAGMPDRLGSCHTATVGGYAIEGHVPAADIQRLLAEKPKAIGLTAPGMPQSAPGMDDPRRIPYDTLLVQAGSTPRIYAHH